MMYSSKHYNCVNIYVNRSNELLLFDLFWSVEYTIESNLLYIFVQKIPIDAARNAVRL